MTYINQSINPQMYPAEAQKRTQLGALLCSRIEAQKGSEWLAALLMS